MWNLVMKQAGMLQAVMTNPGNIVFRDCPEFARFTYPYVIPRFAAMGRILQSDLRDVSEEEAAIQKL